MKPCACGSDHSTDVAVIQPVVIIGGFELTEQEERFLVENSGKHICFQCGGEVPKVFDADCVTGTTIIRRLREIARNKS